MTLDLPLPFGPTTDEKHCNGQTWDNTRTAMSTKQEASSKRFLPTSAEYSAAPLEMYKCVCAGPNTGSCLCGHNKHAAAESNTPKTGCQSWHTYRYTPSSRQATGRTRATHSHPSSLRYLVEWPHNLLAKVRLEVDHLDVRNHQTLDAARCCGLSHGRSTRNRIITFALHDQRDGADLMPAHKLPDKGTHVHDR